MISGYWWLIPVILGTWEAKIGRIVVPGQPGQIVSKTPSPKAKWTGGMALAVEYLLCTHQVLNSNSSPIKKNFSGSKVDPVLK
jgi:hypothetical protein